jgi:hypothetical protein
LFDSLRKVYQFAIIGNVELVSFMLDLFVSSFLALARPASAPSVPGTPCGWSRTVLNGYEPDNTITFTGVWDEEGTSCYASAMAFRGWFRDGGMSASIRCDTIDGPCTWIVDNKQGTAATFGEAWRNMPGLLTSPDDYYEHGEW